MLLVGYCVSRFARLSASPGSLYTYTANTLPPVFGVAAAWGLLLAYLATGASVAGGALYYATVLSAAVSALGAACRSSPSRWSAVAAGCDCLSRRQALRRSDAVDRSHLRQSYSDCAGCCCRFTSDCISIEGNSASRASRFHHSGRRLLLSIFSFVGFESATTLGGEAREPLRTIPRAVLQCALLAGVFFMLCAYSEVLGFRGESGALSDTTSPLHLLARKAGVSPLGVAIDCGAFISMFACVLACATAAARVLMRMAHDGLLPAALERTNPRHGTPGTAVALSTVLMFASHRFHGTARRDWFFDVRPVGLAVSLWIPHRLRAGGSGASHLRGAPWDSIPTSSRSLAS